MALIPKEQYEQLQLSSAWNTDGTSQPWDFAVEEKNTMTYAENVLNMRMRNIIQDKNLSADEMYALYILHKYTLYKDEMSKQTPTMNDIVEINTEQLLRTIPDTKRKSESVPIVTSDRPLSTNTIGSQVVKSGSESDQNNTQNLIPVRKPTELDEIKGTLRAVQENQKEIIALLRSRQPEPASTSKQLTPDARTLNENGLNHGSRYTVIFMTYLLEAFNGRIPENHTLGKSKYWSQLDERIVQLCWSKTLKDKPLKEDQIASTWRAVKNSIDSGWRRNYNNNKKKSLLEEL